MRLIKILLAFCALFLLVPAFSTLAATPAEQTSPANAPEASPPPIDILPAKTAQTKGLMYNTNKITHPEVQMTPDKSEIIHLDGAAASIIIGNPRHLNIIAESPQLLVLSSLAPGATYFTVLDSKGAVIMQRHVIVSSPKENYVRVRKSCAGARDKDCQTTNVYYCPGMCHKILIDDGTKAQKSSNDTAKTKESSGDSQNSEEENPNATEEPNTTP